MSTFPLPLLEGETILKQDESWTSYHAALRIAFDNAGMDYFIPQDIDGWAQAIMQALSAAPALVYTQTPPLRPSLKSELNASDTPGAGSASRNSRNVLGILFAAVFLLRCVVTACMVLPFILLLVNSGGGG